MDKKRICLYLPHDVIDTIQYQSKVLGISNSDLVSILVKRGATVEINKKPCYNCIQ